MKFVDMVLTIAYNIKRHLKFNILFSTTHHGEVAELVEGARLESEYMG